MQVCTHITEAFLRFKCSTKSLKWIIITQVTDLALLVECCPTMHKIWACSQTQNKFDILVHD